jgi:hypothetical protein
MVLTVAPLSEFASNALPVAFIGGVVTPVPCIWWPPA